jgi:hypothetical protein
VILKNFKRERIKIYRLSILQQHSAQTMAE